MIVKVQTRRKGKRAWMESQTLTELKETPLRAVKSLLKTKEWNDQRLSILTPLLT